MRLSLGTAQFGLDYGVTNTAGQVSAQGVAQILQAARKNNISHIDTAAAYGTAEEALNGHHDLLAGCSTTTKIPSLSGLTAPAACAAIQQHLKTSKARLGESLSTVLLHDVADVLRQEGRLIWQTLENSAAEMGIKQIGVSLYDSWEITDVLSRISPDVVQLPFNILDQRLLDDGALDALAKRGCSIEARSVFLQGLILENANALPYHLEALAPAITALHAQAAANGVSPLEIALGFLRLTGRIDRAVVGVTTAEQLDAICAASKTPIPAIPYPNLRVSKPIILDPRCWPQLMEKKRAS